MRARYARSRQELVGTYVVDIAAMFFGMPMALFPAIAARFGGATVLGLLYAAPAVGALLVAATSAWTQRVRRHGMGVIFAATAWGLAIIAFGFATTPVVALLMLAAAGAADCVSGIFRSAIWNQTIPDGLRGRLAGIEFLSYTTGPGAGQTWRPGLSPACLASRQQWFRGRALRRRGCGDGGGAAEDAVLPLGPEFPAGPRVAGPTSAGRQYPEPLFVWLGAAAASRI